MFEKKLASQIIIKKIIKNMQFNNKHTANKEKLKKKKLCKPFFANLNIISSKKIISKHFLKIYKTFQYFVLLHHKNTSSDKSKIKNVTNK